MYRLCGYHKNKRNEIRAYVYPNEGRWRNNVPEYPAESFVGESFLNCLQNNHTYDGDDDDDDDDDYVDYVGNNDKDMTDNDNI